jgi:hypothetical protein
MGSACMPSFSWAARGLVRLSQRRGPWSRCGCRTRLAPRWCTFIPTISARSPSSPMRTAKSSSATATMPGASRFAHGADDPTNSITGQTPRGFTGQEELSDAKAEVDARRRDRLCRRIWASFARWLEQTPNASHPSPHFANAFRISSSSNIRLVVCARLWGVVSLTAGPTS